MKRRTFGALAGGSILAASTRASHAAGPDASLLGTTLTPMGSIMAGNADGSIPAWTGGVTKLEVPLKRDYVPDLFPNEKPLLVINASNMAQHADGLSEGIMKMMTKYGYSIQVYPTHRTASAPQYVYDNIKQNCGRSQFAGGDAGGRYGFVGAYGGVAFPIPDLSDPIKAGGQIIWNHNTKWTGFCNLTNFEAWVVSGGNLSLAEAVAIKYKYPYYNPKKTLATTDGRLQLAFAPYTAPANLVGQVLSVWYDTNPYKHPQQAWELLNGQGRVRRAPEVTFDTPSSQSDGIVGYDEYYGFNGSVEKYDWKYIGKREMYVPYNNNKLYAATPQAAHGPHFLDPNLIRYEKHRCWVIEATLHPGERNVLARRRFYIDEDTWCIVYGDMWDAHDNLFKVNIMYNYCRPDLPGVVYGNNTINNLEVDDYVSISGPWNQPKRPGLQFVANWPDSVFDPTNMAASSQY